MTKVCGNLISVISRKVKQTAEWRMTDIVAHHSRTIGANLIHLVRLQETLVRRLAACLKAP